MRCFCFDEVLKYIINNSIQFDEVYKLHNAGGVIFFKLQDADVN